jgi:hypothetical protein
VVCGGLGELVNTMNSMVALSNMVLPSPLSLAEQMVAFLPSTVWTELLHRPDVRRARAAAVDLTETEWVSLAGSPVRDASVRAQLAWGGLAAGRLQGFLRPDDEPAVLIAALIAHPAEASTVLASWDYLLPAVADLAVAADPDDAVRWRVASLASLPVAVEVALQAPDRTDEEVNGLLTEVSAGSGRPPEPPLALLRLCRDRPELALQWALTDPWLAVPAVASGAVDFQIVGDHLSTCSDQKAVDLATLMTVHPDTPPCVVEQLRESLLAGRPEVWSCDDLPGTWGMADSQRSDEEHKRVLAVARSLPAPWVRWVVTGLNGGRTDGPRVPRWPIPPTGHLTAALGFRYVSPERPPVTPVEGFDWPVALLVSDPGLIGPTTLALLDLVGTDPDRWGTLLSLVDGFSGTISQLAGVTPALT